jgi:hypothetical protein
MSGWPAVAADLLQRADMEAVRKWLDSIWGSKSEYVTYHATPESKPPIPKAERAPRRMPSLETRLRLHQRDGFHCRCCGIPVIRTEVREFFRRHYPQVRIWGTGNANQHAAFQALWVQYDHIVPHALGGTNDFDNLLVTCSACNYGRMQFTFAEVGLQDPMTREPVRSLWDGLERVLSLSPVIESQPVYVDQTTDTPQPPVEGLKSHVSAVDLMPNEIVLHVVGEGGGYTTVRVDERGASRFAVSRADIFLDSGERAIESYESLREALAQINSGWPRLHARQVRPAFAAELFQLALESVGNASPALRQWAAARDAGGLREQDNE